MKNIILVCLLGFIYSCSFVRNKEVFDKYHLIAVDTRSDLCLGYEVNNTGNYVCIVPSQILAFTTVGKYILLKQRPYHTKVASDTNYYIVPILKDNVIVFPEDSIIGPLKKHEFDTLISKMHLGKWEFRELNE